MTATITEHVRRYVAMKRKMGYVYRHSHILTSFAQFAEDRDEAVIRSETVLAWISASQGVSPSHRVTKLRTVHAFACWLRAEDPRHEVPHRDALGQHCRRRPPPHLVSLREIRALLSAALSVPPADTIAPLTWHYLFGLIAATGLRIGEALALMPEDITRDGLMIRDTKFRKSRMIALHPSTQIALNRYLATRRREETPDGHLFVIATGRPPSRNYAEIMFRKLAEQTGIRKPGVARGPTPHSLRHSFAVRSLERLERGEDPNRHMLALATYLGHTKVSATYWYLESTPVLLRGIAEIAEQTHAIRCGGSHD